MSNHTYPSTGKERERDARKLAVSPAFLERARRYIVKQDTDPSRSESVIGFLFLHHLHEREAD